jgi:hypothetical protein
MRIHYKSLVILSRTSTHFGSTERITTVYDMQSVRDHVLDIPASRLLFHPGIPWRVGLFALLPILLLMFWTEGAPHRHPGLVAGVLIPWCALFYSLSYITVKTEEMEQFARRERGLTPETKVGVVEDQNWTAFVSKLSTGPRPFDFTDLHRSLKQLDLKDLARRLAQRQEERPEERRPDSGDSV